MRDGLASLARQTLRVAREKVVHAHSYVILKKVDIDGAQISVYTNLSLVVGSTVAQEYFQYRTPKRPNVTTDPP